jgi:hypothetical protein
MQRIPLLIILLFLAAAAPLRAQTFPPRTWRVQLGLPIAPALNVHLENRVGRSMSVVAKAEAVTLFSVSGALGTTGSIAYVASGELRWYYNTARRISRGKSIDRFSGNFFSAEPFIKAAQTKYGNYREYLPPLYPEAGLLISYGLQRGFGQHGHWGFCAGYAPIAVLDGGWTNVVKINLQIGLQW